MQRSEVLNKILDDYAHEDAARLTPELQSFCGYAAQWLSSRGVVGLGLAQSGMALRFADGEELLLFEAPKDVGDQTVAPAVNITGNAGTKIVKPVLGDSASVHITGR
jgi:hypothetical protein